MELSDTFGDRRNGGRVSGRATIADRYPDRADGAAAGTRTIHIDRCDDEVVDAHEALWTVDAPTTPGHTSSIATSALVVGLTGVYCALSGRLAPIGGALCVIGGLLAVAGLRATRAPVVDPDTVEGGATGPARAGSGLALLALILSVAGLVLAVLALNHVTLWLDSNLDQVSRVRTWLDGKLPWMVRW